VTALFFDCDGVLSDTERYGHLPAFNQTFRELGLPVQWSEDDYAAVLRIGGGKERMASLLTPGFVAAAGLPTERDDQLAEVARWHRRKTEIFLGKVKAGELPARPGVARIARDAHAAGWSLAVCSTSSEDSVRAILEAAVGNELATRFAVFAGDVVNHKKPAPDVYLLALERLAKDPTEVIVVEDSWIGLEAAHLAGLRTIITVNAYTEHEDFSAAALVVSSLGDPDTERIRVIENRSQAMPADFISVADLEACVGR
jgi:HAD superfamily hydrolase (TIGR01509 family)